MSKSLSNRADRETAVSVALEHDLVASSAQAFRRDMLPRIWEGTTRVEIDFRRVRMIDSIGVASLIAVYKMLRKTGGALRLVNVSAEVCYLLHNLRLDRHIEVKASGWEDLFVGKKRILIIDDEEAIRRMMRLALEKAGYEVLDASNGIEGLNLYHEALPDLVITDIFMPEMEGLETIMTLRQDHPDVKIMSISGGGERGMDFLPASLKLGASLSLAKPFTQQELLGAVRKVLDTAATNGVEAKRCTLR